MNYFSNLYLIYTQCFRHHHKPAAANPRAATTEATIPAIRAGDVGEVACTCGAEGSGAEIISSFVFSLLSQFLSSTGFNFTVAQAFLSVHCLDSFALLQALQEEQVQSSVQSTDNLVIGAPPPPPPPDELPLGLCVVPEDESAVVELLDAKVNTAEAVNRSSPLFVS